MATSGENDPESKIPQSSNCESMQIPTAGMVFKSEDDIRTYIREYAYGVGFGVTKRSARKKDGLRYFSLVCSRQGNYVSKSSLPSRPTTGINCKAKINVKVSRDGEFEISKVQLTHNHELSPGKSRRFRCNKRINMNVRKTLELNDGTGTKVTKNFNTLPVQTSEHDDFSFIQSESKSSIHQVRYLKLGEGDANALQRYFCRMQKNKGFFYVMDVSEESRLRNVFWVDARCRTAYEEFADVITFDTTYLTNKYDMPFVSFVGVNHHGHTILLGCALLCSDDTYTFTWLFRCWLNCMSGKAPLGIVTDECQAMQLAIFEVFPHTQHRLCLWHIMKKIPEKLANYADYSSIKRTMKHVVYESLRQDEFEQNWSDMVQKFELHTNEWLDSLYRCRKMWAPVYLNRYFWAGMSITQRRETINTFFGGYIHSKTSLKQFVEEYDNILRSKVEKESHADFKSFSTSMPFISDLHVEKQFHAVYTHEIFKKFQVELKGLFYCNASLVTLDGHVSIYEVTDSVLAKDGDSRKEIKLQVEINGMEDTITCLCNLFQFKGIVCRHVVASMIKHRMNRIPDKYILSRWRKDIKRHYTLIKSSYDDFEHNLEKQRYDELCKLSYDAAEVASLSTDKFNLWKDYIVNGKEKIFGIVTSNIVESSSMSQQLQHEPILSTTSARESGSEYGSVL